VISEQLVKILAFKIRNPYTANPKPKLLSIVKLLILADVPCRLRDNYVGITLLNLTQHQGRGVRRFIIRLRLRAISIIRLRPSAVLVT